MLKPQQYCSFRQSNKQDTPSISSTVAATSQFGRNQTSTDDRKYASSVRSSATSARTSNLDPGDNEGGRYSAIYSFNILHLRELMDNKNNAAAEQADALNKLLQRFGVELISIGLPDYDPVTRESNQELTICAKDFRTLGSAMVKLSELGLPFKKRVDNWFSAGKASNAMQHAPSRTVDSLRKAEDKDNSRLDSSPTESLLEAMRGFHVSTPSKPTEGNRNPWLSDEYDVFSGGRNRSCSESAPIGGHVFPSADLGEQSLDHRMLSHLLQSETKLKSPGPSEQQSYGNYFSVSNHQGYPTSLSRPYRVGTTYFSGEYPILDSLSERPTLPAEESVGERRTVASDEWSLVERPESPAPAKAIYTVPQRRLSETGALPKLRIDTSNLVPASAPKDSSEMPPMAPISSSVPESFRLFGLTGSYIPTVSPNIIPSSPWGPYTGDVEATANQYAEESSKLFRAFEKAGGYHSIGTGGAGVGSGAMGDMLASQSRQSVGPIIVNPIMATTAAAAGPSPTRYQRPQSSSPIRQPQPEQRYFPAHKTNPAFLQENTDPRTATPNIYQGYAYGNSQSPTRFPQPGYQGLARPAVPRVSPVETTSVYTVQQPAPAEAYMKDSSSDAFYSYCLKPIPPTGPRFIR